MKSNFIKQISFFAFVFLLLTSVSVIYSESSKSHYQVACQKLGFNTFEEQKALLDIFSIAGYLTREELWKSIYSSQIFNDPQAVFVDICSALYASDELVSTDDIIRNISGSSYDADQIAGLILYIAQTAFDRKRGQERSELNRKNWMTESKVEYFDAAERLGLINAIHPNFDIHYDAVVVLGASVPGVYPRLLELNYYVHDELDYDHIFVLSGQRELWAEIDGVSSETLALFKEMKENGVSIDTMRDRLAEASSEDKIEMGKKYMMDLAYRNGVLYDKENSIITKKSIIFECFGSKNTVTEAMMSLDLLRQFSFKTLDLIDVDNYESGDRPDTVATAREIAQQFVQGLKDGQKVEI